MSSAIGPVFTYLVTNFTTAVQAVDSTALIIDGPVPDYAPPPPAPMVYVGAQSPLSAVAGDSTRTYLNLGGLKADEDFSIPCYIDAASGGSDQAAARNSALGAYNAIVHLIHNDMTLGGLLLAGRVAEVADIQLIQTDGDEEADDGRRCIITFRVHCANHYTP